MGLQHTRGEWGPIQSRNAGAQFNSIKNGPKTATKMAPKRQFWKRTYVPTIKSKEAKRGWKCTRKRARKSKCYWIDTQTDDNLVVYNAANRLLWASGTNERERELAGAILQDDGSFAIYRNLLGTTAEEDLKNPKWVNNWIMTTEKGGGDSRTSHMSWPIFTN